MTVMTEEQRQERSEYLKNNLEIADKENPYVFVSYASANWEEVFKDKVIVPMQKEYGLRVYADKDFDTKNNSWVNLMLENIDKASSMIAFISPAYIESYACLLEVLTAISKNKEIVFVFLEQNLKECGDNTKLTDIEYRVKEELSERYDIIKDLNSDKAKALKKAYSDKIRPYLNNDELTRNHICATFIDFFNTATVNRKSIDIPLDELKEVIEDATKSVSVFDESLISTSESVFLHEAEEAGKMPRIWIPADGSQCKCMSKEEWLNSRQNGKGTLIFNKENGEKYIYEGEFKDGNLNGYGKVIYDDGNIYKGEWEDGKRIGKGVFIRASERPTGEFKNKKQPDGYGKVIYRNGDIYEGEFKYGCLNGQGTIIRHKDGIVYIGECVKGKQNGKGICKYADGDIYVGEWKDGKRNGQGKGIFANGDIYEGEWKDDKPAVPKCC